MVRLSVIVPFYNVEKYIEKCVISLFEQTYKDMEIIFVDDGGTDGSLAILERLIKKYSFANCKVIHKENAGLPQARKTGVENSNGEYIAFVDSDDWLDKDFYTKCMKYVEGNDYPLYCTGYQMDYGKGKTIECDYIKSGQVVTSNTFVSLIHQRKLFHTMWSKIFRRDVFEHIRFPKGNFLGEDYVTLLPYIHKINEVYLIPETGYHYRVQMTSMGNGVFNHNKRKGFIALHKIYPYVCQWYPKCIKEINAFYAIEYMADIVAMGKNKKYEHAIICYISAFLRRNAKVVLFSKCVDIKFKLSLVPCFVMPRVFASTLQKIKQIQQ